MNDDFVWAVKATERSFDPEYGAEVEVECGRCHLLFIRTVPPLTNIVAKCRSCGAQNRLPDMGFADRTSRNWVPA